MSDRTEGDAMQRSQAPSSGVDPLWVASLGASAETTSPGTDAAGLVRLDPAGPHRVTAHLPSARPTFLARHPSGTRIYATEQTPSGMVHTFAIGADRSLERVATVPSHGDHPCHLQVHPGGRWLYVSNYADATVAALPLDIQGDPSGEAITLSYTGSSVHPQRQSSAHAHASVVTPDGNFLVVADLGGDVLRSYPLTAVGPAPQARLTRLPPGAGPRHLLFHGEYVYVTCELSGDVAVLGWDGDAGQGTLLQVVSATTARPTEPAYLSHLALAGDVLIVGVRTPGTLAALAVQDAGARLRRITDVPTVAWPTHFEVSDEQLVVAGMHADAVGVHRIAGGAAADQVLGPLEWSAPVARPMCVLA